MDASGQCVVDRVVGRAGIIRLRGSCTCFELKLWDSSISLFALLLCPFIGTLFLWRLGFWWCDWFLRCRSDAKHPADPLTGVTVVVVALFRLLWLHINASTMEPFYQV